MKQTPKPLIQHEKLKSNRAKNRGTSCNPESRFHPVEREVDLSDAGWVEEEDLAHFPTQFFEDHSKTILNKNNSPDIGFDYSINPYRGCEHGCIYCYARPTHEYLGLSAGLDFESKIFVKHKAPELLRHELSTKKWQPQVIAMSGVTDCYQPAERQFQITRQCLLVLAEFKNPVGIITKNQLVRRDLDVLSEMAKENLAEVCLTLTTLRDDLSRKLEPRASVPSLRLKAVAELAAAGVPVSVNLAPMIPGLTDHEMPQILKAASDAGAYSAGLTPLRLPHSVKDHFTVWLEEHYPEKKNKVLNAVSDIRGGKLNDPEFGSRMRGQGPRAEQIRKMFLMFRDKYGLNKYHPPLNTLAFRRPPAEPADTNSTQASAQLKLF